MKICNKDSKNTCIFEARRDEPAKRTAFETASHPCLCTDERNAATYCSYSMYSITKASISPQRKASRGKYSTYGMVDSTQRKRPNATRQMYFCTSLAQRTSLGRRGKASKQRDKSATILQILSTQFEKKNREGLMG